MVGSESDVDGNVDEIWPERDVDRFVEWNRDESAGPELRRGPFWVVGVIGSIGSVAVRSVGSVRD